MSALITYRSEDSVGVLSYNRPERHNAVNDEMSEQWSAALLAAIADDTIRCILLRGEGPSFCSGRDTAQLGQRVAGESDFAFVRRHQEIRLATIDAPKPVVAALRGHVLGGGFETALSADVRIASSDTRLGFPEIGFGLTVDTGGSQLLTAVAGPARAKWLLISGERISAQQALEWGIVEWVVVPEELDSRALDIAKRLASAPVTAAAVSKQLVDQAWAPSIRNGIRQELLAQTALFASDEYRMLRDARAAARESDVGRR